MPDAQPLIDVARRNYFRVLDLRMLVVDVLDELRCPKPDLFSILRRGELRRRAELLLESEDSYAFELPPVRGPEAKVALTMLQLMRPEQRQTVLLRYCYACGHELELPCSCGRNVR
jgi:hypothetical protein